MQEPIEWRTVILANSELLRLDWRPLAYSVLIDPKGYRRYGRVAWTANHHSANAGIAWDWAEVEPAVIAIDNPLAIETNIELGEPIMDEPEAARRPTQLIWSLNLIVHGLPWQNQLLEQISRRPKH